MINNPIKELDISRGKLFLQNIQLDSLGREGNTHDLMLVPERVYQSSVVG